MNAIFLSEIMKEMKVKRIINNVLNEYLDKNAIMPLKKYLDKTPKRYKTTDFDRLWYKYQTTGADITSRHAFSKHEIFKNGWVIHFTKKPLTIIQNGFKGINKKFIDSLWRTYGYNYPIDYGDGYAFAYDVNDIPKNAIEYGKYAIMFRTSGLKVYNRGDLGEWQVIFNPPQANLKECFLIKTGVNYHSDYDGNGDVSTTYSIKNVNVINPYTERVIFKTDSFDKAVNWVKTNYRQYSSINASKYASKFREDNTNKMNYMKKIAEYIKSNINGDILELPIDDRDMQCGLTILFDGHFNFRTFLEKFGFTKSKDGYVYTNGIVEVEKYYGFDPIEREYWIEHYKEPSSDDINTIVISFDKERFR